MKNSIILMLCFLALTSCAVHYDPDESFVVEKDRLVVNGILNPAHPLNVYFYTTFRTDTGYWYRPVRDVRVVLKENGNVLYDGICEDTVLQLDYFPRTAAAYSIEASLPGYDVASATTSIPDSITCTARAISSDQYSSSEDITSLSAFRIPSGDISMWVTAYVFFSDGMKLQYNELYANNLLVDNVNRWEGSRIVDEIGGSGYHDAFLRVKNKNLSDLDSIRYSPSGIRVSGQPEPDYKLQETYAVKVITASKEYDQYCRSLYQQKMMVIYDDDISGIGYEPVSVYTNVKNGLGVFAGISESNYYFPIVIVQYP